MSAGSCGISFLTHPSLPVIIQPDRWLKWVSYGYQHNLIAPADPRRRREGPRQLKCPLQSRSKYPCRGRKRHSGYLLPRRGRPRTRRRPGHLRRRFWLFMGRLKHQASKVDPTTFPSSPSLHFQRWPDGCLAAPALSSPMPTVAVDVSELLCPSLPAKRGRLGPKRSFAAAVWTRHPRT